MNLYVHSPPCGLGVYHHALKSPSFVDSQFFELFGARGSTASQLASLWNCFAAHELVLYDRKILLHEGRRFSPFKLHELLKIHTISSWRHA
ncbi:hypothetical protein TNCV_828451 [Trichonephila clavipes]|nr:hypothetical protein TNCV_828451 [Trichonephila clavipes]